MYVWEKRVRNSMQVKYKKHCMKTNQEMVRYIDSFSVVQRTSDGYFDGTELLRQWNNVEGNPRRQMSKFLESDNTSEFLKALAEDESHRAKMLIGENQLLIKVKGRNTKEGKTPDKVWMNPLLFIKFAMWINPSFEVKVLRFVYDEMIRYRNDAGDAYKELGSAVQKIVPKEFMPKAMQKVGEALNWVCLTHMRKCFATSRVMKANNANCGSLKRRWLI